jgi:predicted secreted protein
MGIALYLALYFMIWFLTLFVVLPFGVRTQGEAGDVLPGTPASAPAAPRIGRIALINTVVATVVFAVVWGILNSGLVDTELPPLPPQVTQ